MKDVESIILVGPMGAGKSTIGRLLAKYLRLAFYDSDKEIESRTGVSIPMIFEYEGEDGFRRREAEVLADFPQLSLDDIRACFAYAAERERRSIVLPAV